MSHHAAAGTPAFKRINRAMLFAGFSAFALLYCVQPLMPLLAQQFALTPAQSSWSLSISTLALAGKATVAETAEAAMIEKRLKFMAVTLVFGWSGGP